MALSRSSPLLARYSPLLSNAAVARCTSASSVVLLVETGMTRVGGFAYYIGFGPEIFRRD